MTSTDYTDSRMTVDQQIERLTQGCVDVVRLDDLRSRLASGARSS